MTARSPEARVRLAERRMGPGFTTFGLHPTSGLRMDPFLNLDDFRMSEPTFPPHPHAGFSAVTYMFEDSAGGFVNRDSLGDRSRIGPGTLHWTQAGSGMLHEEVPEAPGVVCHGLQMFVNLRADHKRLPPRAFHLDAERVPEVRPSEGARVRVLVGGFGGVDSPMTGLATPILLLDVQLAAGGAVEIPVERGWTAFALTLAGAGVTGPAGGEGPIEAHEAHGFRDDGDGVRFAAGGRGLHLLVAAGRPIGEPVVFGGPFVGTTRAEVDASYERYRRGEMGRLERSF